MKRKDQVWKKYSDRAFGLRSGCQKAARMVERVSDEITHDILWGLKPVYTGKVIRRRPVAA